MAVRFQWPREHGAWAMLLFPFAASLLLAGTAGWESLAALVAALGVFGAQEPLLVAARQRYRWKGRRPESADAAFTLAVLAGPVLLAGAFLFRRLDWRPLIAIGVAAAALLLARLILALRNRQRSAILQVTAAAGLSASCLLGYLSARGTLAAEAFLLWALFFLHHGAALMVVRARLEAIVAARSKREPEGRFRTAAWVAQAILLAAISGAAAGRQYGLALAFAIPFALHTRDLLLLGDTRFLETPLVRVGLREMAISAAFAAASVWSLL